MSDAEASFLDLHLSISDGFVKTKRTRVDEGHFWPQYFRKIEYICLLGFVLT